MQKQQEILLPGRDTSSEGHMSPSFDFEPCEGDGNRPSGRMESPLAVDLASHFTARKSLVSTVCDVCLFLIGAFHRCTWFGGPLSCAVFMLDVSF